MVQLAKTPLANVIKILCLSSALSATGYLITRDKIINFAKCTPYKLPMIISLHGDIQLISVQGEPCSMQLAHWSIESDDKSVVLAPSYATQPKSGFVEISGKGLIYKGRPSASAPDTFRVNLEDGLKTVRREVVVAIMPNEHSQAAGGRE